MYIGIIFLLALALSIGYITVYLCVNSGGIDEKTKKLNNLTRIKDDSQHLEQVENNYDKLNIGKLRVKKIDEDIKEPVCQKVSEEVNTFTNQNNNDNELTM